MFARNAPPLRRASSKLHIKLGILFRRLGQFFPLSALCLSAQALPSPASALFHLQAMWQRPDHSSATVVTDRAHCSQSREGVVFCLNWAGNAL